MAISHNVRVIYQTVGNTHIIKAVFKPDVTLATITALQASTEGYDGVVELARAQLTDNALNIPNDLLGMEYYLNAGVPSVRALVEDAMYKIASRQQILTANLRVQIENVRWGLGRQFSASRTDRTAAWLRKSAAVIQIGTVLANDTDYSYLLADTRLDPTQWLVRHDEDTWPAALATSSTAWYRTSQSWSPVQVAGVSVSAEWHTKDLIEELAD